MTLASEIIQGRVPDFTAYIKAGESLDDIDEYGFTPLIESVLAKNKEVMQALIQLRVDINKSDIAGRTALQWAVDTDNLSLCQILLEAGADPNLYTRQGFSALVYPLLRQQSKFKQLLLKYGASLHFAQDFISAKLLGHRFALIGRADIVTSKKEMIEVDFEGFILEFTVVVLKNSLERYIRHFQARKWLEDISLLQQLIKGFELADKLLTYQRLLQPNCRFHQELEEILQFPFLILPTASSGHAMGFIRYHHWLAKIDRGENSLKEGSVNIYEITKPEAFNVSFLDDFIFRRQPRKFFHEAIIPILGLKKIASYPMASQISGNCSWANLEACVAVGHWMLGVYPEPNLQRHDTGAFYQDWLSWDRERAIEEIIYSIDSANKYRKGSLLAMLGAVLFQFLSSASMRDNQLADKILKILVQPDYLYIIQSYLNVYAEQSQKTAHGENLKHLLDNNGYDSLRLGLSFSK